MINLLKFIGAAAVIPAILYTVALVAVLLVWPIGAYECWVKTTSFEHRYLVIPAKCQVLVKGRWVDWDSYKGVLIDEEVGHG